MTLVSGLAAVAASVGVVVAILAAHYRCYDDCLETATFWGRDQDAWEWTLQLVIALTGWACAITSVVLATRRRSLGAVLCLIAGCIAFAIWWALLHHARFAGF